MNNKIQFDRIIMFLKMKTGRIERKKENICFTNCSRLSLQFFLIKLNKVLTAVIHTVNHLVYAIYGEV